MHHGVTKVCSPAIFQTCFSHDKMYGIAATIFFCLLHNCAIFIDGYSPVNKFYNLIRRAKNG